MANLISMQEAQDRISAEITPLPAKDTRLEDAIGRYLLKDLYSSIDLPPFSNSAMDGYALKADDIASASEENVIRLKIADTIAAGSSKRLSVATGSASPIMTGAMLPDGADCVVQLENARRRDTIVEIRDPVKRGHHIRVKGEDTKAGTKIASAGDKLTPQLAALIVSTGIPSVLVPRQVKASVLATGRELKDVNSTKDAPEGSIFDSNGITMRSMLNSMSCNVTDLGIATDDSEVIKERISSALDSDLILISGGVSVGKFDHVKQVLADLGMRKIFWRTNMKPGKPLLCGRINDTWVFGLPGNPISCAAGIAAFVEPLIKRLHGAQITSPEYITAILTRDMEWNGDRQFLATAHYELKDGNILVTPTKTQGSAMLHSLAVSNCFMVIPEKSGTIPSGSTVNLLIPSCHA